MLEPFSHGSNPLAATLQHTGDPGLFGPDTVTWPVVGDISTLFGGVRALLIQFAHPEVAAGMVDLSSYERDPLGRISRTTNYVAPTSFGAMPEVEQALAAVPESPPRGQGCIASEPGLHGDDTDFSAWVDNALSDSFLSAYQHFGPRRLSPADADRFSSKQVRLGETVGAEDIPTTASDLTDRPDRGAGVLSSM